MLNYIDMLRFGLALATFAVTLPALATGEQRPRANRVAVASVVVQRTGQDILGADEPGLSEGSETADRIVSKPDVARASHAAALALPTRVILHMEPKDPKAKSKKSAIDYKSILSKLVIARDLTIPGAPTLGLRLIPAKNAITGTPAPLVFTPRVVGSGWYGLDFAARF
jgi:hypothetical protein